MAKYYYNGVLLPEIPADVLKRYSELLIYLRADGVNYRLLAGTKPWYVNNDIYIESSTYVVYSATAKSESWTYETQYTDDGNFGIGNGIKWSNHDIANGSATSTDIYFYGSEPVPEGGQQEPEEPESVTYTHTIEFTDPEWKTKRPDVFSVTDGTTPFFVDSTLPYDNKSTFRSGRIADGGTSETTVTFTLVSDGSVELNYTVSSESNYDWLCIYVDDAEVVKKSGSVSWTVYTKNLSAGNHTLKFKYTKDGSSSKNSDAGAIGYVTLTGVAKDYDRKYLIQSGDSLFTVTDGALVTVEGSVNADLFRTYGVDEIPASELLVTLTDPVVLYWVDTTEHEISSLVAVEQAVPFTQTLESEDYNMNHSSIVGIEKVLVDASDGVRFAVSFDVGQTWKIHTGEAWTTLSEGDTGMSPSVLSAITTEDWNTEATTGKFRFRVTLSTVDDYVNSLVVDYLN